jgi:hypothetical protein
MNGTFPSENPRQRPHPLKRIGELREKYLLPQPPPLLAVAGARNAGKSTLINALLQEDISPVDVLPATPCSIFFFHGQSFSVSAGRFKPVHSRQGLASLLRRGDIHAGRVDVTLPNPWLRICTLIDTPGLDAASQSHLVEKTLAPADHILYLFHQRGMDEQDRLFLHRLKGSLSRPGSKRISFWINCNCGRPDGSALTATREALGEIFGREIPVNYLNTRDAESIENLRLFVEVELAFITLKELEKFFSGEDRHIPRRLAGTLAIGEDGPFLNAFWSIYERARDALETSQLFASLQQVRLEIREKLAAYNRKVPAVAASPAGMENTWQAVSFPVLKERLLNLLQRLLEAPFLRSPATRERLAELAGSLAGDRFYVTLWGPFSSGKSTFLNALMQEELLPAQDKSTTSTLVRLHHGAEKVAVIHYPRELTLFLVEEREGNAYLCREELVTLYRWLNNPGLLKDLRQMEACTGGRYSRVNAAELAALLIQTQNLFRSPALPGNIYNHVPAITRPISLKRAALAVTAVRLHFHHVREKVFHLADPGELAEFRRLMITPEEAMLIEAIDIHHPAEMLKLATFVDSPGIDSVHTRYARKVAEWLRNSDLHLIFFNGRHMLSPVHREFLRQEIPPERERDNCFYVVNFADTLNLSERERVATWLRRELAPAASREIHFISALDALKDGKNLAFNRLLRQLEQAILIQRGEKILLRRIDQIGELLAVEARKSPPVGRLLEKYSRELEDIRLILKRPGGYRIWRTPASLRKG